MLRVLGHVDVTAGGHTIPVGGPVPRRILTALAAAAGGSVTIDGLVEAAWGDDQPPSAERSLASHVTRLREALSQLPGSEPPRVERTDAGLRLVVARDQLDALHLDDLVRRATTEPPASAATTYREALALWRGQPFADLLDTAYPAAEAARLTELQVTARVGLVSALLDAGDASAAATEAQAAVNVAPFQEPLWELLAIALYRQGRQADALAAIRRARAALDDGLGIEPGPGLRAVEAQILQQDPTLLATATAPPRQRCPYKGLTRYDTADSDLFVGREREVDELVSRLVDERLLVVVGPSGAGKSSLVRAGLLPALAAGALPGSERWPLTVIEPGPEDEVTRTLAATPEGVVVVDQTEELLLRAPEEVTAFGDSVVAATRAGTRVVLTLRADFYGRLAEHPSLARRAGPATVLVTAPDDDALRRIVVEPAARAGLRVDPALVDTIVSDVAGRPGALPVLSTALVRTWEHRDGDSLTRASYLAGGGVAAALQRAGEDAWVQLDTDGQRAACRRLLLRLATMEEGQWVRRRVPRTELVPEGDVDVTAALQVLTDRRLVVARLDDVEIAHESLLTGWPRLRAWLDDGRSRAQTLDRLAAATLAWSTGDHDRAELYRGTRLQAALDAAGASPDDLTSRERDFLEASRQAAEQELLEQRARAEHEAAARRRTRAIAVGLAGALLLASVAGGVALQRQQAAAESQAVAEGAATEAMASDLGARATSGKLRYDTALLLAAQAYAMSPSIGTQGALLDTLSAGDAVRRVVAYDKLAQDLQLTPDGSAFVSADDCGHLDRWPVSTLDRGLSQEVPSGAYHFCGPMSVAFTQAGEVVAPLGDPTSLPAPGVVDLLRTGPKDVARGAWALSPDGRRAAALGLDNGGYGGRMLLWSVPDGETREVPLSAPGVWATRCGDAICVLTADMTITRRSFADGHVLGTYSVPGASTFDQVDSERPQRVVAGNDGRVLVVPRTDHLLQLLDLSTGAVSVLAGSGHDAQALAFSRDGRYLAARDGADVLVYDRLGSSPLPLRLRGHSGRVMVAAFTRDDATLLSIGNDHAAIVWDLGGQHRFGRVLTERLDPDPDFQATTLWAAGRRLMVGTRSGDLILVNPADGTLTRSHDGVAGDGVPLWYARSANGSSAAVTSALDGTVAIWDLSTGSVVHKVVGLPPLRDPNAFGMGAWVSPDGRQAAVLHDATGVRLVDMDTGEVGRTLQVPALPKHTVYFTEVDGWTADGSAVLVYRQSDPTDALTAIDVATGRERWTIDPLEWPSEVVPAPDGRFLAMGGDEGVVRFRDPVTGAQVRPDMGNNGVQLRNISFSPDGRLMLVSGGPPQLLLFDARTLQPIGGPLPVDPDARDVRARFMPDGSVAALSGRTLRVFPTDPAVWLARACREAGRTLTREEWNAYLPGVPYAPACTASAAPSSPAPST